MRSILIIFNFLFIFAVFGQNPGSKDSTPTTSDPNSKQTVQKIQEMYRENEIAIEEIKKIKAQNEKDLEIINSLEKEKRALIKTISQKTRLLTGQKQKETKKIVRSTVVESKVVEKYYVADSVCTQFTRNFFGIAQCVDWKITYREVKN